MVTSESAHGQLGTFQLSIQRRSFRGMMRNLMLSASRARQELYRCYTHKY